MPLSFCQLIWLLKKKKFYDQKYFCVSVSQGGDEIHYINIITFRNKYQLHAINT